MATRAVAWLLQPFAPARVAVELPPPNSARFRFVRALAHSLWMVHRHPHRFSPAGFNVVVKDPDTNNLMLLPSILPEVDDGVEETKGGDEVEETKEEETLGGDGDEETKRDDGDEGTVGSDGDEDTVGACACPWCLAQGRAPRACSLLSALWDGGRSPAPATCPAASFPVRPRSTTPSVSVCECRWQACPG